jgi:serine protease Do
MQIRKSFLVAGFALLAVPASVLAQDKNKDKNKDEKKDIQQIIITRPAVKEKTVIEIDGDKVKVNGKDVKNDKDINVSVNNLKGANVYHWNGNNDNDSWAFNYNGPQKMNFDRMDLFSEDANRAMLGVITESEDKGAEIQSVTEGSAADKAGLKKGDIITKIDNKAIETHDDVANAVKGHKPGEKVSVTFLRNNKTQTVTAELGKWKGISAVSGMKMDNWKTVVPPELPYAMGNGSFNGRIYVSGKPRLGLSIQDTEDGKGVKVLEVEDESNAAKAGIEVDDVILTVDDKDIKGTDDVTRIVRDNNEKSTFNFKVLRDGKTKNIEVKIPKKLKTTDL